MTFNDTKRNYHTYAIAGAVIMRLCGELEDVISTDFSKDCVNGVEVNCFLIAKIVYYIYFV